MKKKIVTEIMKVVFLTFGSTGFENTLTRIQQQAEQLNVFNEIKCVNEAEKQRFKVIFVMDL